MVDEDSIRNYYARYKANNIEGLTADHYVGNQGQLSEKDLEEIDTHFQEHTYRTSKEAMDYINGEYDTDYSERGIIALFKRLNYVYKKPQRCPGKVDATAQALFIKEYQKVRGSLGKDDRIYFMVTYHQP